MDISALSENNFNATQWINTNYKQYVQEQESQQQQHEQNATPETNSQPLQFINSYVANLHLYVQQVNFAVEETSQQLLASMPRIVLEAHALQSDMQELQKRMHNVRAEVAMVQAETGECMSSLEQLNMLQTKVQLAKETLQQSDGWGNLIAVLEDAFERNDLPSVCKELQTLQKSLVAQQQLSGHAERESQAEDFKNRMEALASQQLVQCFAAADVQQAQYYVHIFAGIERLPQLLQYYRAVHKTNLQQQWKQTLDLFASSEQTVAQQQQQQTTTTTTHFLTLFYDALLEFCQRQAKWCVLVFGAESQQQVFIVLVELLPSLQPSRDVHILQLLKSSNERLELLQQYALANHAFVRQLNALMLQLHMKLSQEMQQQLSVAIYEYFHKFIQQYARLEETQLSTQIDRLLVSQSSLADCMQHLEHCNYKVFDWLQSACERCLLITDDLALCKLIPLLSGSFTRLLETYDKTQRQLQLCSMGQTEQWSLLQYSMSLLQYLADYQQRLQQFEQLLLKRLTALHEQLNKRNLELNIYQTVEPAELQQLIKNIGTYRERIANASNYFDNIHKLIQTKFAEIHDLALAILLKPVELELQQLLTNANFFASTVELPSFSLAPQEYITQIGQYLLMLPQHLEPLLLAPSPQLKLALEQCHDRYTPRTPCADILLELVVEKTCSLYCTQILQIKTLSAAAAKHLAVDIEYLSNVTEELGGLTLIPNLAQILKLLKTPAEQYLASSSGCEPRLVTAIRQMRNIISMQ